MLDISRGSLKFFKAAVIAVFLVSAYPQDPPAEFQYNNSTLQAFYFFFDVFDSNGETLTSDDWVAAFNGDICVGARRWDLVECGGICDVPTMGDDGAVYTDGYMQTGEFPTFKIYISAENKYYSANPSEQVSWANFNMPFITSLNAYISFDQTIELHYMNNLISFYTLPDENSVSSILSDLGNNVLGVLGANNASQIDPFGGDWSGSLLEFNTSEGFWIKMDSVDTLSVSGSAPEPERIYNLNSGLNLLSFPVPGAVLVPEGLPDEIENNIQYIISESVATTKVNDEWIGSLVDFQGGKGYWFYSNVPTSFSYELTNLSRQHTNPQIQNDNSIYLSQLKAFYFMDNIPNIEFNDRIMAYQEDVFVGSRHWQGKAIDVPVMGYDGSIESAGFSQTGDIPTFKIEKPTGEQFNLIVDTPEWQNNQVYVLNNIQLEQSYIPTQFKLRPAYPNPFNPSTTFQIDNPLSQNFNIRILNIVGQEIDQLYQGELSIGQHIFNWDASSISSGIYFIYVDTDQLIVSEKIVLLK